MISHKVYHFLNLRYMQSKVDYCTDCQSKKNAQETLHTKLTTHVPLSCKNTTTCLNRSKILLISVLSVTTSTVSAHWCIHSIFTFTCTTKSRFTLTFSEHFPITPSTEEHACCVSMLSWPRSSRQYNERIWWVSCKFLLATLRRVCVPVGVDAARFPFFQSDCTWSFPQGRVLPIWEICVSMLSLTFCMHIARSIRTSFLDFRFTCRAFSLSTQLGHQS